MEKMPFLLFSCCKPIQDQRQEDLKMFKESQVSKNAVKSRHTTITIRCVSLFSEKKKASDMS